jgi:hypothetical protein
MFTTWAARRSAEDDRCEVIERDVAELVAYIRVTERLGNCRSFDRFLITGL